ncbi:hypothetical protein GCM10028774_02330 [Spirosoma jeollabukense]
MPAFKALGTDPSNLLRPSDIKKFAAMLTPFYSNRTGVIPKNFALEFAPWKLASKNWKLNDYNTQIVKRFLYRSSFSFGTINDTTKYPAKLSVGYRVSFLSKRADIYRAAEIRNLFVNTPATMVAFVNLTNHWVLNVVKPTPSIADRPSYYQKHRGEFNDFLSTLDQRLKSTPDPVLQGLYDALINTCKGLPGGTTFTDKELKNFIQVLAERADDFIEKYKKNNWNASRLDIALALAAQSPDTLISNAQFSLFSVWATWALRIHKGGQLLIGGNFTLPRTDNISSEPASKQARNVSYNANIRYYLGTQDVRGFIETQYKYKNFTVANESLLFNLGAEFRLGSMFWVVASAGIDNYLNEPKPLNKFVSSLDLRYFFNKPR